jgi:hypothetical protein
VNADDAMLPVQAAVYRALVADEDLMALVAGVFDGVPEGTDYDYVDLGEVIDSPRNSHDRHGRESVLTLHIWTRYRGFAAAHRIGARVMAGLDHQPLDIEGLVHVSTRYEQGFTMTDPAPPGDIRHLVQRYRITTEQPGP